jgi:hypothetical protein
VKRKNKQLHGRKHGETPHPLGARNFATVARCLGNLIIGVGVRVRSILLRYERTVMMRHVRMDRLRLIWSSPIMIVTLAQRLVIVTLPQRIVMMTLARRLLTLAHLRRMMTLV